MALLIRFIYIYTKYNATEHGISLDNFIFYSFAIAIKLLYSDYKAQK